MPKFSKKIALGMTQISGLVTALLDSNDDPASLVDPAGTILDVNGAGTDRFKTLGIDVIGASLYELEASAQKSPEYGTLMREKADEVLLTGNCLRVEEERGGKIYNTALTPVFLPDRSVTYLVIVVKERLSKQLSELHVQKVYAVYQTFRETRSHSFSILDANGVMMEWNKAASDTLFGKSEEVMLGFDGFTVIHPDDRAYEKEKFLKVLELGIEEAIEVRVLVHGGPEYIWRMFYGSRVTIDGKPCVFLIGIDITERKHVQDELVESRKRFRQALEATHAGIWEWDLTTGDCV